jgi:hypothetical protein
MPQSVIVQLREGHAGNIRLFAPENVIKCQAKVRKIPGQIAPVYDQDAPETPLASPGFDPEEKGWNGTIYCRDFDPQTYEDRPKEPSNKPGTWNRVRIDSDRGKITVYVNNKLVNEITDCNQTRGRIGFTSNLAEWYIGKIELVVKAAQPSAK